MHVDPLPDSPASLPSRPKLVLVVDDYDGAAEMLGQFIELTCSCEAITALDGAEAVRLTALRHPDAVVMDIDMPVMNGIEAARLIRQTQDKAPPLLIALSGGTQLDRARTSHYFDHAYAKPADIDLVSELLSAHFMGGR